jgi:hypothetical protein
VSTNSTVGRVGETLTVPTWDSNEPQARTKLGVEVTRKFGARPGQFLNYIKEGGRVIVVVSDIRERGALWSTKIGPDSRSRLSEARLELLGAQVYDTLLFTFLGRGRAVVEVLGDSPPDEIDDAPTLLEGAKSRVTVNAYERNPKARRDCIEHYGPNCSICGFNFEECYGAIGRDYIHVHHLKPFSEINAEYVVDPVRDLRPVCPNCHAMLHRRKNPPYSIKELKAILRAQRPGRR